MNIDELRTVQSRERSTSELQELRDSFYEDVADYLSDLRDERDRIATERDDPYDDDVIRLTDQIRTAEQVTESIYERRVGKVVKHASFTANGQGDDPTGLTTEERALFTDIVDCIKTNKEMVLDVITDSDTPAPIDARPSGAPDTTDADAPATTPDEEPSPPPSDDTPESEPDTDDSTSTDDTDRATVRITEDIGEIYGVDDRIYTLETDDVVTLPKENASPLLERDAAESLE